MGVLGPIPGSVVIASIVALPALLPLWSGLWKYRMYKRMQQSETTDLVTEPTGQVKVTGTVRPLAETVTTPATGTESVAYDFDIEVHSSGTGENTGGWSYLDQQRVTRRFLLEGPTGEAVVDPDGFDLHLETDYQPVVEGREEAPPEVMSVVDGRDDITLTETVDGHVHETKARFTEVRLEPGTEVHVVGAAKRNPSAVPAGVETDTVVEAADVPWWRGLLGQPIFVTDRPQPEAMEGHREKAREMFFIAGVWLLFCVGFALLPVLNSL